MRKVSGLRREEVAVLASLSVDYYTRLEQGRERRPSRQVLDALADALQLEQDARSHLFGLAGLQDAGGGRRALPGVHPQLARLLDAWPQTPALILDASLSVLAANSLARVLLAGFGEQANLVRMTFSDPFARRFYPDWDRMTVANLRATEARAPDDPGRAALIAELEASSPEFAELWERHDVRAKRRASKRFDHPQVGRLALDVHAFDVPGTPGQQLVVDDAEPGTASAQGLALLGTLAAETPPAAAADVGLTR